MRSMAAPWTFTAHPSRRRGSAAPRDEAGATRLPDSNVKELVTRVRILAARPAPELCHRNVPLITEGAGNAGCAARTHSLACKQKRHASRSHHRSSRITQHSPRNGFNGFLRAVPGVRDVLVTVIGAMRSIVANLTPAKGRQNHTTSPSASAPLVKPHSRVHRIPSQRS